MDGPVLLIPLTALSIPIIAIISAFRQKSLELKLRHSSGAASQEIVDVKKRLSEMEARVATLQDIIISGEYESRKKIQAATERIREAEAMAAAPAEVQRSMPPRVSESGG